MDGDSVCLFLATNIFIFIPVDSFSPFSCYEIVVFLLVLISLMMCPIPWDCCDLLLLVIYFLDEFDLI